jgi:hypothetical protein
MEQSACRGTAKPKMARNSAPPVRNRTRARRLLPDFPELHAFLVNLPSQKVACSAISFRLSWELPATPGCPDQYRNRRSKHHGATCGRTCADCKVIARSRNCTDSLRCSARSAYSISFGPKPLVPITQNRKDRQRERDPNRGARLD